MQHKSENLTKYFTTPSLEDAGWRNEVKAVLMKRIEDTRNFNSYFKDKAKPRTIDPAWERMLKKINQIDEQIALNGIVDDVGIYRWTTVVTFDLGDTESENSSEHGATVGDNLNIAVNFGNQSNTSHESVADDDEMPELEGSEDGCSDIRLKNVATRTNIPTDRDDASTSNAASVSASDDADVSNTSGEPCDVVRSFPITNSSISTGASSFVTSEEDDRAIAEDIFRKMPEDEVDRILTEAVKVAERNQALVQNETSSEDLNSDKEVTPTPYDELNMLQQNGSRMVSTHLYQRRNSYGPNGWRRPCLKGIKVLMLGDSSVRAFGRKGNKIPGHAIVAYGGIEILELAAIIRSSCTSKDRDFTNATYIKRILTGRDEVPLLRWCNSCKDECYEKFSGKALFVVGLNNSMHAASPPHIEINPNTGLYENVQDFKALFKYFDETIARMLPNATVKYSPMIACTRDIWKKTDLCQNAFKQISKVNSLVSHRFKMTVSVATFNSISTLWVN